MKFQAFHPECLRRRLNRVRKFCWMPTKVWSSEAMRDGFRWFCFAWFDVTDGRYYTKQFA